MIAAALALALAAQAGTWEVVQAARDDTAAVDADAPTRIAAHALAADLVRAAVHGEEPPDLDARAAALSLGVHREEGVVVVHGTPGHGWGALAVRLGRRVDDLVLVAPHAWHDLGTGELVGAWFDDGFGRVAVFNTVHRYRGPDEPAGDEDADVAHRPHAVFHALSVGAADGLVDPLVVQVHGFSPRRGEFGAVVADGGALQPGGLADAFADAIRPHVEGPIGWGDEIWRLAATKNVQGHALSGRARFVHLELSRDTRRAWRRDPIRRAAAGTAMARLAGGR